MERFARKLELLDIPVYGIGDESEIFQIAFKFMQEQGVKLDERFFQINKIAAGSLMPKYPISNDNGLILFEAWLGVEESAIIFLDQLATYYLNGSHLPFAILLNENNIVESIEVALHRINFGSSFYGQQLDVVQPKDLSGLNQIFILKS